MSCIDALIHRLCPDGVTFKQIAEIAVRSSNIRWKAAGAREYQYIDLSSVDRLTGRIDDTATIDSSSAPSRAQQIVKVGDVIFATTRPTQMRWAVITPEFDSQIASTGYCVLRPIKEQILTNFLAYVLGTNHFKKYLENKQVPGNYPSIPDNRVRDYRIPVPPLEIQQEIVAILDNLTKLKVELEEELKVELETRRQQYQHYRDTLLGFPEPKDSEASSQARKIMALGEVGNFIRGSGIQKSDFVDAGVGCIHYGQIHTHYGTAATSTKSYICPHPKLAARLRMAHKGNLVIATTSEDDEAVGKAVAWLGEEDVAVSTDAYIFRHTLNPKYVSYFFQTEHFQSQKKRHVTGTKVRRISGESMAKILIPVPPLEEQERIVAILDRFDELTNDLSTGLTGEIKARRLQYGYYRDRLLTFKEAA